MLKSKVYYLSEVVVIYLFPEKLMMGPKEMSAFKSVLISHIYNWIFAFKITQFSYDLPSKLTQLKTQPHHSTNFLSVDVSVYISLSMCKCSRFTISKQQTRLSLLLLLLFNKKCTVRMDIYVCLRILRKYMDFMAQRKRIKIEICALLISKPLFSFWFETWWWTNILSPLLPFYHVTHMWMKWQHNYFDVTKPNSIECAC